MANTTNEHDDGLTDEERAALLEDDGGGEEHAVEDKGELDDTAAADKAASDAAAAADDTAKGEADAAPEQQPEDDKIAQSAPILIAEPLEDASAKLADIDARKDALLTQFDDGDITAREYQKQLDALAKEERAIERAQDRAELAAQMETQRLQNDWATTCNTFVAQNAIYKDNPRLYRALDTEVRELAAKPETASWTGQKFLEEAHKNLQEAFGFKDAAIADPTKTKAKTARELPPNLAKVPAANVEDTNGGRFAVLDRMASSDPMAYEDAISKMSDAERNAYLAS
jgi:hypothetical protein